MGPALTGAAPPAGARAMKADNAGARELLDWASQRQVHAHYLAPLAPGGRVEIGKPRPVRSPTAG